MTTPATSRICSVMSWPTLNFACRSSRNGTLKVRQDISRQADSFLRARSVADYRAHNAAKVGSIPTPATNSRRSLTSEQAPEGLDGGSTPSGATNLHGLGLVAMPSGLGPDIRGCESLSPYHFSVPAPGFERASSRVKGPLQGRDQRHAESFSGDYKPAMVFTTNGKVASRRAGDFLCWLTTGSVMPVKFRMRAESCAGNSLSHPSTHITAPGIGSRDGGGLAIVAPSPGLNRCSRQRQCLERDLIIA